MPKVPKVRGRPRLPKVSAEIMLRYSQGEKIEALAVAAGVSAKTLRRQCQHMDDTRRAWQLKRLLDHNYQCLKGPTPDLLELGRKNDAMIAARMQHMLENPDMHLPPNVLLAFSQLNERITECELARRELEESENGPKQVGGGDAPESGGVRLIESEDEEEPTDD